MTLGLHYGSVDYWYAFDSLVRWQGKKMLWISAHPIRAQEAARDDD